MKASHARAKILFAMADELMAAIDSGHEWLYNDGAKEYGVNHSKRDLKTIIREAKALAESWRARAVKLHPKPWRL